MDFDITTLIKEIKKRQPLWLKDSFGHSCRDVINSMWLEVADVMGVSKELVKAKWKGLRDNFRSELRKIPKKHQEHQSKWIYFNDMLFLKDQMTSKYPCVNYVSGDVEDVNVDVDVYSLDVSESELVGQGVEPEIQIENGANHPNSGVCNSSMKCNATGLKRRHSHEQSSESGDLWENSYVKRSKVNSNIIPHSRDSNLNDDDYYFLISLLPTMKSLPLAKKMYLRLKIQELVYNEISKSQEIPTGSPAPSSSC